MPQRFEAQADLDDATIELSWRDPNDDGDRDITAYELQFKEEGEDDDAWVGVPDYVATEDDADHGTEDAPLANGVTFNYRVRAINVCNDGTAGNCGSEDSDPAITDDDDKVWAMTSATTPSAAPAMVDPVPGATFSNGSITVTWTAPEDNGEAITSYKLRWRNGNDDADVFPGANVVEVDASATEYIIPGPDPASGYQFQVVALNALNYKEEDLDELAWSGSSIDLAVLRPAQQVTGAPNALAADVAAGTATITWRMVADTNGYRVASYDLEYVVIEGTTLPQDDVDEDGDLDVWDDATTENIPAQALMQRFTDPLQGDMNLFVRLRIVSMVGTKSLWRQTSPPATNVPARPADNPELAATIIGQNIILSWEEPASNGTEITNYELQFKVDDGDFSDEAAGIITIAADATSYSHEELESDATYTYRIRSETATSPLTSAANDVQLAARTWSAEVEAQSDPGPPATPERPDTPVFNEPVINNEDDQIELSWTKPMVEGSSPITSYQINRWNGSAWELLPTNLGAEDTEYDDTSAELGKPYWYAIRAVSSAGAGEWTQALLHNGDAPGRSSGHTRAFRANRRRTDHHAFVDGSRGQRRFDQCVRNPVHG